MKTTAIKISREAGKILMKNFGNIKKIQIKGDSSYVSNVDLESEKLIISLIKKKYPEHNIIAEESGIKSKKSDYTWYIDPLDGTNNYIQGFPFFGVSIGVAYKGEMKFAAINLPYFNETYFAEKNKGAYLNGKRIKVSNKKDIKKSFVLTDAILKYGSNEKIRLFNKLKNKIYDLRALGSAVIGYTMVAKGCADAYYTTKTFPWDVAAGALIVEEARGKVTDFKGNKWSVKKQKFISSNKKIHNRLLNILTK